MAVQQNPRLTDGWWLVKGTNDWGRGLGILTDGWWFPECLPLDILYFNLAVGIDPRFGVNVMDEITFNMNIVQNFNNIELDIAKEKELDLVINTEEEIDLGITTEVEIEVEG